MEEKKPKWYSNKIKYVANYNKKTYKRYELKLNQNTESDLIEFLDSQKNKNEYLKSLLIKDFNK